MKWNIYHTLLLTIYTLFFNSCHNIAKNKVIETKKSKLENKNIIDNNVNFNIQSKKLEENELKAIEFLKSKELIDAKYPNEKVISYESRTNNFVEYCLLKLNNDDSFRNKHSNDPIINFLYIKKGVDLIDMIILYTIDSDDLVFSFEINGIFFYQYYDSLTGWHKYYSYLLQKRSFLETRSLDESEKIDRSSIKTNKELTYQTDFSSDKEKFILTQKTKKQ
ncbi:hypothetical protein [Aquimarina sp. 2201CG5-10]|uniref:hypothetical protein n=1 Tax=Aquimarina callyspongiae TaxID=3098150 RepID=UPI002AB591C5|nr:hypothetical protein [Aquimarina sp. 2201CG5-10]MDY8137074.1 hypothetical protein [Aquimarina sp. 2201CG5-10]